MAVADAVAAVADFARHSDGAGLPPFPSPAPRDRDFHPFLSQRPPASVLKPFVTDRIPGEVLPRGSDAWLAILPFNDLGKNAPAALRRQRIQRRRALVEILATIASAPSPPFRWDATTDCMGRGGAGSSFWLDLMRELDPTMAHDKTQEMVRCLIAMSQTRRLRLMVCVTQTVLPADLPDWLEKMLSPIDDAWMHNVDTVLAACGMSPSECAGRPAMTVEIGLSFSKTEVSGAFMKKLLGIMDRCTHQRPPLGRAPLRVTSLRFGRDCVVPAKTIELLGQAGTLSTIDVLDLGNLQGVKLASLRLGMNGVLKETRGLRRLVVTSFDMFKAVASSLRSGVGFVDELELEIKPTVEYAAWIAFTFFHADSKSSASSLRLRLTPTDESSDSSGSLTSGWLNVFKRTLRHVTARELVNTECEDRESDSQLRQFVTIKVGTAVKDGLEANATVLCKVDNAAEMFQVITAHNKCLAVIVPGVGVGWVRTSSIASTTTVASLISPDVDALRTNRKVTSLAWLCPSPFAYTQLFDDNVKLLLEMVQIVGEPLRGLHLPGLSLTTERVAQVLAWCPNLTDLNINGHSMTSFAPISDAYTRGSCQIATLSAVRTSRSMPLPSITAELNTILRDPRCALRRLAVYAGPAGVGSAQATAKHVEGTFELMRLLTSQPLAFVQLSGTDLWKYGNGGADRPVQVVVDVSANPFCVSPMEVRSKLAFLGCLQHNGETSARSQLDAGVLALIFRFSGRSIARHVLVDAPLAVERGLSLADIAGSFPYVSKPIW